MNNEEFQKTEEEAGKIKEDVLNNIKQCCCEVKLPFPHNGKGREGDDGDC